MLNMPSEKSKKELSFDEAMQRLQEIVTLLESGQQPLEKSIELFEEGHRLSKICEEKLKNARQRVSELCDEEKKDHD